jgi:Methylmalonyl-CoA mutase
MVRWDEFEKISTSEWVKKINFDLKGKKLAEDFKYVVCEGLECSPFLTESDVPSAPPVYGPHTRSGVHIIADQPAAANLKARSMLSYGAQALSFEVDESWDLNILFEGIYLDMIHVILKTEGDIDTVRRKVEEYTNQNYGEKNSNIVLISSVESKRKSIHLEYQHTVTERLQLLKNFLHETPGDQMDGFLVITLDLKKDFLAQVAELRAIRKHLEKYKTSHSEIKNEVLLISQIHRDVYHSDQIHPLIISNYLIMSSYLGMSDFSFGLPYDEDEEAARLCLNIQHIFNEESYLGDVSDPVAGSYIIEKLTEQMLTLLE